MEVGAERRVGRRVWHSRRSEPRLCQVGDGVSFGLEREGIVEVGSGVGQIGGSVLGGVVGVIALQLAEVAAFELEDDLVEEVHESGDGLIG